MPVIPVTVRVVLSCSRRSMSLLTLTGRLLWFSCTEGGYVCGCRYDRQRLQQWLLCCCQDNVQGGLCDKPDRPRDYYHTSVICYIQAACTGSTDRYRQPLRGRCIRSATVFLHAELWYRPPAAATPSPASAWLSTVGRSPRRRLCNQERNRVS